MISFIIPAYNEEKRISKSLFKLVRFLNETTDNYEIICVVDGIDNTDKIVKGFALKNSRIKMLKFGKRLGKGGAIIKGVKKAKGRKIMLLDADLSISLKAIYSMIKLLDDYDIVVGSRYIESSKNICPLYRKFLGKICNYLERNMFNLCVKDIQAGFKAFKANVIKNLIKKSTIKGFSWDLELLLNAKKANYSIKEFPIEWFYEKYSKTNSLSVAREIIVSMVKLKVKNFCN